MEQDEQKLERKAQLDSDSAFAASLKAFAWLVAGGAASLVAVYVVRFGTWPPRTSGSTTDWGVFGDYVGGTVGTFFAFAAFFGVLATVAQQRRQIIEAREQGHLQELQRLLASSAQRLDDLLHREAPAVPDAVVRMFKDQNAPLTTFNLLSSIMVDAIGAVPTSQRSEVLIAGAHQSVSFASPLILTELEFIAECLRVYVERGGEEQIVHLYRFRYSNVAAWLHIAAPIIDSRILATFKPDETIERIKSAARAQAGTELGPPAPLGNTAHQFAK